MRPTRSRLSNGLPALVGLLVFAVLVAPLSAAALLPYVKPGAPVASPGNLPTGPSRVLPVRAGPVRLGPSQGSSIVPGVYVLNTTSVGSAPTNVSYDPANGLLYITNFGPPMGTTGNSVSIISDTTNALVASVGVGDDPLTSTYDPSDGYVYVQDFGTTHNLTVINGTTVIASIQVGIAPTMSVYDAANGYVYVTNSVTNNISVVQGLSVIATIPLGAGTSPCYDAYDPLNQYVYVANLGGNNVTVISGTSVIANISTGASPCDVIVDKQNGYVYVPNSAATNVSVLNGTSFVQNISVGVGARNGIYDAFTGEVFIANEVSNNVSVINGTRVVRTLTGGGTPRGGAFDLANGFVYIENWQNRSVSVFNDTTLLATAAVGYSPYSALYDPASQTVYVPDYITDNVSAIGNLNGAYSVTFDESGLPGGTEWNVTLNSTTLPSTGTTDIFPAANGTESYRIPPVPGFYATPNGTVSVSGRNVTVDITFERTYAVNFTESGLAAGTAWTVAIGSLNATGSSPSLVLAEPNGSYNFTLTPIPGYATTWTGAVTVSAAAVHVPITFTTVVYSVVFTESNLAPGTSWTVHLGTQTNTSISATLNFTVPNGTYAYSVPQVGGYADPTPFGNVSVHGADISVAIPFEATAPIYFTESGLPIGTNWTITLESVGTASSTTPQLQFNAPPGFYNYSIAPIPGYLTNWTGNFTSNDLLTNVAIVFNPSTYLVTFVETGLKVGTNWSVDLNGTTVSSTLFLIQFASPNGTQPFQIANAGAFVPAPANGSTTVNGREDTVPIVFTLQRGLLRTVTFTESGLPNGTQWGVELGGVGVNSTTSSLAFHEPDGSYRYTVYPVLGFAVAETGTFSVAGANTTVAIPFVGVTYRVTFEETGLPAGTSWGVSLGGTPFRSTTGSLEVSEANGSYPYYLLPVNGYNASNGFGTVTVSGAAPATILFTFNATTSAPQHGGSSFPILDVALLGIVAVVGIAAALLLLRRRGGGGTTVEAEEMPPPEDGSDGYEYASGGDAAPEPAYEMPAEPGDWNQPPEPGDPVEPELEFQGQEEAPGPE